MLAFPDHPTLESGYMLTLAPFCVAQINQKEYFWLGSSSLTLHGIQVLSFMP